MDSLSSRDFRNQWFHRSGRCLESARHERKLRPMLPLAGRVVKQDYVRVPVPNCRERDAARATYAKQFPARISAADKCSFAYWAGINFQAIVLTNRLLDKGSQIIEPVDFRQGRNHGVKSLQAG